MSARIRLNIDDKHVTTRQGRKKILGRCFLEVEPGQVAVLLGESGCGKSSLLRLIVGLDTEYDGEIKLEVSGDDSGRSTCGMVFQEPRLLPWLSALGNVMFGVARAKDGNSKQELAMHALSEVGLSPEVGSKNPRQLSGGMAQRVALARALVNLPHVLLLDEPFGALDLHTRLKLQDDLLRILADTDTTALLVTHDIDEALYMGDQIAIMSSSPGEIIAVHQLAREETRSREDRTIDAVRLDLVHELMQGR